MKEQLYEIPVNDAFDAGCECSLCRMYHDLERDAIEYTMGSSYMQEDVREMSDKAGFCPEHIRLMYDNGNRLGLALMLDTHYNRIIKEMKKRAEKGATAKGGLFAKKTEAGAPVTQFIHDLEGTCFVCDYINRVYPRYIDTILYLWKTDDSFKEKFRGSKGFCVSHYAELFDAASEKFKANELDAFIDELNKVFFDNIDRVKEDIAWFIEKYDYRNKEQPWKNSKDALQRGVLKLDHVFVEEPEDIQK